MDLEVWKAAAAADRQISRHPKSDDRLTAVAGLADVDGCFTASQRAISLATGTGGYATSGSALIDQLEAAGLVKCVVRGRGGRDGFAGQYRLTIPAPEFVNDVDELSAERAAFLRLAYKIGSALIEYSNVA